MSSYRVTFNVRYNDVSELPHNLLLSSTTPEEPCAVSPSLKLPCLPQWGIGLRVRLLASEPPGIQFVHSSWISFPTKKPQATNNKTETHRQQESRPRKSLSRSLRAPAAHVEAQGVGVAGAEVCSQGPPQILEGAQCWRHRGSDLAKHPGNWTEMPKRLHLRSRVPQYLPWKFKNKPNWSVSQISARTPTLSKGRQQTSYSATLPQCPLYKNH